MKWPQIMFICLLLTLFSGCRQIPNISLPSFGNDKAPLHQVIPTRIKLTAAEVPADAKLVISALIHQVYMQPKLPKEIVFNPAGQHQLYDPSFDYSGFQIRNIDIITYDVLEPGSNALVLLGGAIQFEDGLSRQATIRYMAKYRIAAKQVIVEESRINPIQPTFPRVQCFFVPERALEALPPKSLPDFQAWYLFALANAERMAPTTNEKALRKKWEGLSLLDRIKEDLQTTQEKYVIMVFGMDRIVDDGSLLINFAGSANNCPSENHQRVKFIDENGWKIGILGAEFAIDDWRNPFYVNIGYYPGKGTGGYGVYPVQVGSFSNSRNYSSISKAASPVYHPGPIEAGSRFLNPANKADARLIQQRLADLGFYQMTVDGLFGKGSKASLQKFRVSKGLGHDGRWDMQTQTRLFQGTGF